MFQLQSPAINEVATALAKAQAKFPPIPKNKTATIKTRGEGAPYTYNYADIADVLSATRPVLASEGLALIQAIETADNGRILLKTMLVHGSGQYIGSIIAMRGNGGPQDLGSELSYFRRYSSTALLGVAAEEDDDGARGQDAFQPQRGNQGHQQPRRQDAAPPKVPRPQGQPQPTPQQGQAAAPEQRASTVQHADWVYPAGTILQGRRLDSVETPVLQDYFQTITDQLKEGGMDPAQLTGVKLDIYNYTAGELLRRRAAAAKARAEAEVAAAAQQPAPAQTPAQSAEFQAGQPAMRMDSAMGEFHNFDGRR